MPACRNATPLALLLALFSALSALFAAMTAPSTAQAAAATWRCGNTYTDHPCEGGRPLTTDDPRDSGQQRDADAMARRAQSAADRMAKERLQLERSVAGHQAVLIAKPPETVAPKKTAEPKPKLQGKKQRGATDNFTAQGPGTGVKAKQKKAKKPAADKA